MNTFNKIIFALSFLLLSSCATLTDDITTETYTSPDIDFSNYRSYSWLGSARVVFDPIGQWEQPTLDTDEEVRFNINHELRDNGMYEASSEPDVFIAFAAGIDMATLELKEQPEKQEKTLENIPKAALLIAMIDADSGYVVWLGYAEGDVQEQQTIDNIRERIRFAVSEIFSTYNR